MSNSLFSFDIVPDDGDPYVVDVSARDILAWEKTSVKNRIGNFQNPAFEDYYSLAYLVARRHGHFDGTRKEFEEQVEVRETTSMEVEYTPKPSKSDPSPEL